MELEADEKDCLCSDWSDSPVTRSKMELAECQMEPEANEKDCYWSDSPETQSQTEPEAEGEMEPEADEKDYF